MGELKYLNKFFYHYRKRIITGIIITIVARIFALVAPNLVGDSITLIEEYSLKNSIDIDFLKKGLLKNIIFIKGLETFFKNESKDLDSVIRNLDKYLGDFEDIGLIMGLIKK